MAKEEDVGIIGGVSVGLPILMTMGAFLSVALYNVIELNFLIFAVFKQRKGLYFWSLIFATWGIAPHAIGFTIKFFQVIHINVLSSAVIGFGWVFMVTGQSLVLYSRLHLVLQDKRKIRWVLYLIIFDAIVIHCPVIVLALGSEFTQAVPFVRSFVIYDKIQIVVFSVQEAIISAIYIYETARLLQQNNKYGDRYNQGTLRKLLAHLIFVNVMVVALDVTLLAVQFSGHYEIQTTYKTAVYSVKLKIEFSVLNRLVQFVTNKRSISGSIHLKTFTSSKKTGSSTFAVDHGSLVKMDDESQSSKKRPELVVGEISITCPTIEMRTKCSDQLIVANCAAVGSMNFADHITYRLTVE
ncbi:hypothetical protein GGP41_002285 [Bipolaris sorokiniana]|uniref:DUF7703 domain-containing protein n=1 Tax=Cochliobolus sativus TaxID=45130 RepID=A0A8H6DQ78_COCSA|nr:hypothetical protein GGP41_002285 [Bipolaris sorokiniana]